MCIVSRQRRVPPSTWPGPGSMVKKTGLMAAKRGAAAAAASVLKSVKHSIKRRLLVTSFFISFSHFFRPAIQPTSPCLFSFQNVTTSFFKRRHRRTFLPLLFFTRVSPFQFGSFSCCLSSFFLSLFFRFLFLFASPFALSVAHHDKAGLLKSGQRHSLTDAAMAIR